MVGKLIRRGLSVSVGMLRIKNISYCYIRNSQKFAHFILTPCIQFSFFSYYRSTVDWIVFHYIGKRLMRLPEIGHILEVFLSAFVEFGNRKVDDREKSLR